MAEEEKSSSVYAALCYGTDKEGTWLWCDTGMRNADTSKPFYADVINGGYQVKYDPKSRTGIVTATKQIVLGLRLAGLGHVPKAWFEVTKGDYNDIIEKFLRTGEYLAVEYFAHDRI